MIKPAYEALVTEAQRAVQNGFTASELGRTISDMSRAYQSAYDEREKQSNAALVWECFNHFTSNEAMPGIELEVKIAVPMLESIELEEVNAAIRDLMPSRDLLIFVSAPDSEKANIPTEAEANEIYNRICDSKIPAWVDNVKDEPLIAQLPTAGTIKSEKTNKKFGTTEWVLSNGMKVILKPTDFKEDEVQFSAVSMGGYSSLAADDIYSAQLLGTLMGMSGLGNFDAVELSKLTAGKKVSVGGNISRFETTIYGGSSAKLDELELMLQELYLTFTAPRFDQKAFNTLMDRMNTVYANKESDPNSIFSRKLTLLVNDDNQRSDLLSLSNLKKVKLERMQAIYNELVPGAQNYTVYIVGNIDPAQLRPLVCQYLAALPKGDKRTWKDDGMRYPDHAVSSTFSQKMETPKTSVAVVYAAPAKYTLENMIHIAAIEHVLGLRNTEEIREKEGGTYGVSERGILSNLPIAFARMIMFFDTDPEKADALIPKVADIFDALAQDVKGARRRYSAQRILDASVAQLREYRR